jgi:hypothetical protein
MMTSEEWNEKYPVGTKVIYHATIGANSEYDMVSATRSKAWTLCGTPVVMIERKAGGVAIEALDIYNYKPLMAQSSVIIRKARKDHVCSLCFDAIRAGSEYFYQRVTPWDHSENDSFFNFKAHGGCYAIWDDIAQDNDGMLPSDKEEWDEMTEGLND